MSLLKLAQLQKIEVKLKRHKLIWNTVQTRFCKQWKQWRNKGASGGIQSWAQALRAHQRTLQLRAPPRIYR